MSRTLIEGLNQRKNRAAVWCPCRGAGEHGPSPELPEPWEAHYWAVFLKDFPGDRTFQSEAETLARKLASDSRVRLAQDADRAIQRFTSDYFNLGDYKVDQQPNPKRSADADALAEKYSDIPHGALIRQLGGSS